MSKPLYNPHSLSQGVSYQRKSPVTNTMRTPSFFLKQREWNGNPFVSLNPPLRTFIIKCFYLLDSLNRRLFKNFATQIFNETPPACVTEYEH